MSKRNIPLEFMLGMTHEEFEHWVWCGEHSEDNVVELHKEALRLHEEVEHWKKLADAKVVFASNGNNEYQYELQEENERLRKALRDALKLMDNKFYGMAHKNIVEALGHE